MACRGVQHRSSLSCWVCATSGKCRLISPVLQRESGYPYWVESELHIFGSVHLLFQWDSMNFRSIITFKNPFCFSGFLKQLSGGWTAVKTQTQPAITRRSVPLQKEGCSPSCTRWERLWVGNVALPQNWWENTDVAVINPRRRCAVFWAAFRWQCEANISSTFLSISSVVNPPYRVRVAVCVWFMVAHSQCNLY